MKRAIDNGVLLSDLDAAFLTIRNLGSFEPPPSDLVTIRRSSVKR